MMLGKISPLTLTRAAFYSALVAVTLLLFTQHPLAQSLKVNVTQGVMEPIPIAIAPFTYSSNVHAKMANDVQGVITADLKGSGLFRPIDKRAFIQNTKSISEKGVNFAQWRAIGAQALVTGHLSAGANGETQIEFRLWDVLSQRQLAGKIYAATPNNWRRVAHISADSIYERLTGEEGYFDTRLVYIAESGSTTARVKQLAIMDQDGANVHILTDGGSLVLTPRFSPNQQMITYMSYRSGTPQVYLYNLTTGQKSLLGHFPGMTFAPRFSPNGKKVIMSMSQGGNSDVYVMDIKTRQTKRITTNPAIDTAPSFSPDGKNIVFESDRGGTQQLYVTDSKGSAAAKRITFGHGRYANPVWSPRGDLIAFTRMYKGKFYIGVIRPDGTGERLIADAYHVEGPTWAPNGRRIAYFKELPTGRDRKGRRAQLYTIDITGHDERVLKTSTDASDPAWSPLGHKQ